jgi:hypothetical protein
MTAPTSPTVPATALAGLIARAVDGLAPVAAYAGGPVVGVSKSK